MVADEPMNLLRRYLEKVRQENLPVKGLILYGSHARGDAGPDSDIDVLVILEDGLSSDEITTIWTQLEHCTIGVDTRIETWPVTESRYRTDQVSPLILAARREGILVAA